MALLKSFGNLLSPKRTVPTGQLTIDWSHPLANGLIACYVPGAMGGINIANPGVVTLSYASSSTIGMGPEGPGLSSLAANSGMVFASAAPSQFLGRPQMSLYYRCFQKAADPANACHYIGINYTNAAIAPYVIFDINASTGVEWQAGAGTSTTGAFSAPGVGNINSLGATYVINGNVFAYQYGKQFASGSAYTSNPTNGATPTINLNMLQWGTTRYPNTVALIGCIWNRALSADEMAWLDAEPYCFLLPAEGEMPSLWRASYVAQPSFSFAGIV